MPVYGKLGDLIGRKGLFIGAISIFIVGSVIGGLSHDMTTLIAGRAVQGLGGGGLILLSQAIIADVVPARQRGRYMGVMGGVFALASVAGPLLGGWFTEGIGWRWAFWINIPLGLLAIASAMAFLHLRKPNLGKPRIDYLGMVLVRDGSDVSDPVHDLGRKHLRLGIGRHHRVDRRLRRDGSGFCLRREACRRTGDSDASVRSAQLRVDHRRRPDHRNRHVRCARLPADLHPNGDRQERHRGWIDDDSHDGGPARRPPSGPASWSARPAATRSSPSSEHPSSLLLWSCSHV